jgi:excisionase family DNA binding protein
LTERSSGRRDARRVTVGEAAALLGISKEAVRMRIRRGTLRSEKTDDRVYVWLDDDLNADQDTVQHGNQTAYRELIEQLRGEVEAWREEARRKDHIIAGLIERLPPQLEPPRAGEAEPPDEPGDDLTATEDPDRVCPVQCGLRPAGDLTSPLVAQAVGGVRRGRGYLFHVDPAALWRLRPCHAEKRKGKGYDPGRSGAFCSSHAVRITNGLVGVLVVSPGRVPDARAGGVSMEPRPVNV